MNKDMPYKILVINTFKSPISDTLVEEGTILAEAEYIDTIRKIHSMLIPEFKNNCKIIKVDDIN